MPFSSTAFQRHRPLFVRRHTTSQDVVPRRTTLYIVLRHGTMWYDVVRRYTTSYDSYNVAQRWMTSYSVLRRNVSSYADVQRRSTTSHDIVRLRAMPHDRRSAYDDVRCRSHFGWSHSTSLKTYSVAILAQGNLFLLGCCVTSRYLQLRRLM